MQASRSQLNCSQVEKRDRTADDVGAEAQRERVNVEPLFALRIAAALARVAHRPQGLREVISSLRY